MLLFTMRKVLGLLAMPMGILWVLLLLATLRALRRKERGTALALALCTAFYSLMGSPLFGRFLIRRLERGIPLVNREQLESLDAVYVLGGGTEASPSGEPQLSGTGDRVALTASLWHAGKAALLVTGGTSVEGPGKFRDLGQETRVLWLRMGVPENAILVLQGPCRTTREEITALRRLQDQRQWRRLGLVTSAWHLPRALRIAERCQLPVIPLGADWHGKKKPFQIQECIPQNSGFEDTQRACWEHLGRLIEH